VSSGEVVKTLDDVIRLRDNRTIFQKLGFRKGMWSMTDPTALRRVRQYRAVQKNEREIVRVDLQIPVRALADLKAIAKALRDRYARIDQAKREIDFVLGTINAPRPHYLDAKGLVHCLTTLNPEHAWFPHIEALFDEVSVEAIHDLVLTGVIEFEDLYRAARTWRVMDGRNVPWIKEMADFSLARPAGFNASSARHATRRA
jgi:hypothetical protein